jgi:hypothetical protein
MERVKDEGKGKIVVCGNDGKKEDRMGNRGGKEEGMRIE